MKAYRVDLNIRRGNGGAESSFSCKAASHVHARTQAAIHWGFSTWRFEREADRVTRRGESAVVFANRRDRNYQVELQVVQLGDCSDGGCA